MNKYILTIDQGTTSSRAIIFNQYGNVENLTDEQWDEFLKNYDHDKFRTQIAVEEVSLRLRLGNLSSMFRL